jgi:hypothetical protein
LNLVLQAIILGLLGSAVYFRLKRRYVTHGVLMSASMGLHTVAIFAIMVPSLISLGQVRSLSVFALTHSAVGSLVEVVGVWLVASWLTNIAGVEKCVNRKNIMRVTIALWVAELILGVYVYATLYLPP